MDTFAYVLTRVMFWLSILMIAFGAGMIVKGI